MLAVLRTSKSATHLLVASALMACLALAPVGAFGDKKKSKNKPAETPAQAAPAKPSWNLENLDYSKIIFPNPPAATRLKYLTYFSSQPLEKIEVQSEDPNKKKSSWMERMAGGDATGNTKQVRHKTVYVLDNPYGMVVDKAGRLYVADGKVGAVFIFNPETKECELIKSGNGVRFGLILGLTIDDDDTLYVSDVVYHRVMVYDAQHHFVTSFNEGMAEPSGLALDIENRPLYVGDTAADQVLVYDADTHKLIRRIGTGGKAHRLTSPGDFAMPTNAVVDKDGNLYVADTWNNRVEVFDADGQFIRAFGKGGDGPGRFARPKGIAIDSDGHIWVADAVQDSIQAFTSEGRLLLRIGRHGILPGQFSSLTGLVFDKQNRLFTAEIYPGRVQMFRYFTDAEAKVQEDRQKAEDAARAKQHAEKPGAVAPAAEKEAAAPAK